MSDTGHAIVTAVCIGFIGLMILGLGCSLGAESEQRKAIKAGVGRYVADPVTGSVEFKYEERVP